MDLKAFIPKDAVGLTILDPRTGEPTDVVFTLAGPAHAARLAAGRTLVDAYAAKAEEGQIKVQKADAEAIQARFLADCTLGWSGLTEGGKAVRFDAAKALEIYSDARFTVIRTQVDRALGDNKRFFE
jgi:hypothetical protein